MNRQTFADAALVLLAHGTAASDEAAAPVYQHAATLRERRLFGSVHEAFWKQSPRVREVLDGLQTPRVFIVPLFMSAGYFGAQVIPRELGFAPESLPAVRPSPERAQRWIYCAPIGTHQQMTGVVLARARQVVEQFPFPRPPVPANTTLFIAGHGTERADTSRESVEVHVARIRAMGLYAAVHGIFLEETPRISRCYELAATRDVVVVPFFLGEGPHTQEDIPIMLQEPERLVRQRRAAGQPAWRNPTERHGRRIWYAAPVGTAAEVVEVILERVNEAARIEASGPGIE